MRVTILSRAFLAEDFDERYADMVGGAFRIPYSRVGDLQQVLHHRHISKTH
jgi:hypothetical protein